MNLFRIPRWQLAATMTGTAAGPLLKRRLRLECLESRRLLAAGDLDPSFDLDGRATTSFSAGLDEARAVAIHETTGAVTVAGFAPVGSNGLNQFAIAQYRADGSLNTGFAGDGMLATPFGKGHDRAFAVAVQPDGKIIAAGETAIVKGSPFTVDYAFALARYKPDGALDTTFGGKRGTGKITTNFDTASDSIHALAIQPDGKIVAGGTVTLSGSGNDFGIARYNADGTLDSSFGSGGTVSTNLGSAEGGNAMVIQNDGKIILAGVRYNSITQVDQMVLARYNPNGALDGTFGNGGTVIFTAVPSSRASDVALQQDGKILVSSTFGAGATEPAVVRFNADGTLDTSFGIGGYATINISTRAENMEQAQSVDVQSDGKILVAGFTKSPDTTREFFVARLLADGMLDPSYGAAGVALTDFEGRIDTAYAMALQGDGAAVVIGTTAVSTSSCDFAIARYLPDSGLAEFALAVAKPSSAEVQPPARATQEQPASIDADAVDAAMATDATTSPLNARDAVLELSLPALRAEDAALYDFETAAAAVAIELV